MKLQLSPAKFCNVIIVEKNPIFALTPDFTFFLKFHLSPFSNFLFSVNEVRHISPPLSGQTSGLQYRLAAQQIHHSTASALVEVKINSLCLSSSPDG